MVATVRWNRFAWTRRAVLALCGALVLAAGVASLGIDAASGPSAPAQARTVSGHGLSLAPVGARAPISAALGAREPSYWIRGLRGSNRAQRLALSFSPAGVRIGSPAGWVRLSLAAVGRPGRLAAVDAAVPKPRLNQVTYPRGAVDESYANGPLGLEQSFSVSRAPAGTGPVVLSLALRGDLRPRMDGASVLFGGARGLRYGDLLVTDATGRHLPASLSLSGSRLRISIDAAGARYPLHVDPLAASGATLTTEFMTDAGVSSVAVDGDTIAVGESGGGSGYGAVLVFEQQDGAWNTTPVATLTASDPGAESQLGESVAISGNTIVAGDRGHGSSPGQGSVYVFVEPATGWKTTTQTAELNTDVGQAGDNIGQSVGISGNTVVAGAPLFGNNLYASSPGDSDGDGAAFVWVEPSTGWPVSMHTETAELTPSDGVDGDQFGASVAISGDEIGVGAPDYAVSGALRQGMAYVFEEPAGGWANMIQTAELKASDGAAYDELGESVAITGNEFVAGAPGHTNPNTDGYTHQGAIYELPLPTSGTADAGASVKVPTTSLYQGALGSSVGLAGGSLIAAAPDQYQAYVFPSTTAIVPSDAATNDSFLDAVADDGPTAVIGAYSQYTGVSPGNVWVYPGGGSESAPTVSTGGATAVTLTSAALGATIGVGDTDTNYLFEYGTSAALGATLPAVGEFGAGTGTTAMAEHAQELTGLTAGTTYYYRACATNAAVSTPLCGAVESFKTLGSAPPPSSKPTPSVGKSSVSGTTASVPLSCSGSGTCSFTVSLSVTETLSGGKVVSVSAIVGKKKKAKKTKKTVKVGSKSVKLTAGRHETIKLSLNGTGTKLLGKHPTLKVELLVSASGKKVKSSTLTFKKKKTKKRKK
jgi:hypothetical protein